MEGLLLDSREVGLWMEEGGKVREAVRREERERPVRASCESEEGGGKGCTWGGAMR